MKKKGFTLVELLAVIVILAIIALITVPIVLKTISNSEVQAEKRSIEGYARVIEDDKANEEMLHPGQQYQIKQEEDYDYKGNKVFCQERYFDEKDKLVLKNCYVSEKKLSDEEEAKKNHYNYINGKVEKITNNSNNNQEGSENNTQGNNSNTTNYNKIYEAGQELIVKNEKYNVIGEGENYVTLLKQEPLTVDEVNQYKNGSDGINHVNRYTTESVGTAYNQNGYGGMAYYTNPTCGYATQGGEIDYSGCASANSINYNSSDIKYIVDNWVNEKFNFNNNELVVIDGYAVRLPYSSELIETGWKNCKKDVSFCLKDDDTPRWIYSSKYGYWTMSRSSDESVLSVSSVGFINGSNVTSFSLVVRPVINIDKSNL